MGIGIIATRSIVIGKLGMVTAQKKKENERHPDFDTTLHIFETMQVSLKIGFKFVCQVRSTKSSRGQSTTNPNSHWGTTARVRFHARCFVFKRGGQAMSKFALTADRWVYPCRMTVEGHLDVSFSD